MIGIEMANVFIWYDGRTTRCTWQPRIISAHGEKRSLRLVWNPRLESEPLTTKGTHEMSRKKVIQEIVSRHNAKLPLTVDVVTAEANELYQQACDQFGTWETALQYAGINIRRIRNIKQAGTRDEFKQAILDLSPEVLMSQTKFIIKNYRRLYNAAIEHYGSWSEGLKAAGWERSVINTTTTNVTAITDAVPLPDALQTSPPNEDNSDRC